MPQVHLIVSHSIRILNTEPTDGPLSRRSLKLFTDIHKPRAVSRAHPLVPRRAQRIDLHTLHVDLESACRLARIYDERVIPLDARQFLQIAAEAIRKLHITH